MKKLLACLLALNLLLCTASALADAVPARLNQRIATRTGPGTGYTEPGSFLRGGDEVIVHTKVWDDDNEIWWVQVEFSSGGYDYRAYTGSWRMSVNLNAVPTEYPLTSCYVIDSCWSYAGPGSWYYCWGDPVYAGTRATLWEVENGYGLIECRDSNSGWMERVWVKLDCLSCGGEYTDWDDTYPDGFTYDDPDDDYYGYPDDDDYYGDPDDDLPDPDDWSWCVITSSGGNVRSGAGAEYRALTTVSRGEYYEILDQQRAANGVMWYQIYCNGHYGWISSGLTNHGKH